MLDKEKLDLKNKKGFNRIVENPVYRFFRAEELQQIVVGAVVINWKQIEDNAKYHDGEFRLNLRRFCLLIELLLSLDKSQL